MEYWHLFNVTERLDFRGETPMHAEELLVNQSSQWKTVKGRHASIVDLIRVLQPTFKFQ